MAGLVAGALGEAERAAIATHAAACARCHALLDGLLDSGGLVAPASPDDETLDEDDHRALPALRPGARVGRYVLEQRIGAGGMGVVFAATDSELHRRVALKLLRPNTAGEIGTLGRERMMREARLLASFSHPNVVTVFDVGAHDGHVFIAMELVDGGNLTAWLRRAPRTQDEIIDRMIEAGRGLAAAHAGGVVHRDVKPDNILVGSDGRARVTDFGLARIGDELAPQLAASKVATLSPDLTKTGTLMGTPVYMAPEQWRRGEAVPRTDQWSYCAALYEVIAGVRPFSVDDPAARAAEIAGGQIAPPAEGRTVPGWLRRIVARGLAAEPSARWPSMNVVIAALVRGRHRRRRRLQALAAVAMLVAIGGSLGVVLTRRSPAAAPPAPKGFAFIDTRPGCSCPFSRCEEGRCLSVCKASDFTERKPVPGINEIGTQQALLGASADHDAILYLSGAICDLDRLMLARKQDDTYVPVDLTPRIDRTRVEIIEGCCSLTADGKSIIAWRPDHRGFVRLHVSGTDVTIDADVDELAHVAPSDDPDVTVMYPYIANDELTLYYTVHDHTVADDEFGPLAGQYASTRASRDVPFPIGRRLPGPMRQYSSVSGESSDHLSLFVNGEWRTHVLTRASTSERYDSPGLGMSPAIISGWRTIPSADCERVLTTYTPGGCRQEDIVWLEAIHEKPRVPYSPRPK